MMNKEIEMLIEENEKIKKQLEIKRISNLQTLKGLCDVQEMLLDGQEQVIEKQNLLIDILINKLREFRAWP
jgi:uncharacterized coiled-coil protein SlyX